MSTSRWLDVVNALAAAVQAQSGYRSPSSATSGVTVYVGPQQASTDDPGDSLAIGSSDSGDAGTWTQEPRAMSTSRPRWEEGQINCVASSSSGDLDPGAVATAAFAIVATVEQVLRADQTVGLSSLMWVQVADAPSVSWAMRSRGPTCEIAFTVAYRASI